VPSIRINYYVLGFTLAWTCCVIASLAWNIHYKRLETIELVRIQAETAFKRDIIYRRWNEQHGGVYGSMTDSTAPNPYLKLPERDITTPSGQKLTKINPAYMSRQVFELAKEEFKIRGHITSLNPIRPENAPDPWERRVLQNFEKGQKEAVSVDQLNQETYLRFMRPLIMEKGCLKCHADQGYQVGDIRGGISVSIPMAPSLAVERLFIFKLSLAHAALWLIGMLGIRWAHNRIKKQVDVIYRTREALRESENKYRSLYASMS
jgi:hypothetical protein